MGLLYAESQDLAPRIRIWVSWGLQLGSQAAMQPGSQPSTPPIMW